MPCPRCAKEFQLADVLRGQVISCPDCGQPMRIEPPETADDDEPLLLEGEFQEEAILDEPAANPAPTIGVDPKRLTLKRLRKKRRRRGTAERILAEHWSYFMGGFGPFMYVLLGLFACFLFGMLLTPFIPPIAMALVTVGGIFYMIGWWWIVFIAYADDGWSGNMCLFTMLYTYVYVYLNVESTWKPAGLLVLGILMQVGGYTAGIYFGTIKM